MKLLPVLLLLTGCASATPPISSPAVAMRARADQSERDAALVDHWIAGCGERSESEDPACRREHEAMFETLEMHRK